MASFTNVPPTLKQTLAILKNAADHEKVDPVITYWCRLYAVQMGLKIDSKSKESRQFLASVMAWLEEFKKAHKDNEMISNELKSKYAKWRAAYINKCLKTGDQPFPPTSDKDEIENQDYSATFPSGNTSDSITLPPPPSDHSSAATPTFDPFSAKQPPTENIPIYTNTSSVSSLVAQNGTPLKPESLLKAQKYCKYAGSSLQYEDVQTAILNLEKALTLLKTGQEID
ncbi:vacuolar protein sorting-associated protein VTA1-like isoform X1 [Dinothrombium tinctorium]|uniref:Vacuolar protein sorting-associated protein VTA1-like isoform X1 n=1 Tax=Dinothrombium tinctorium TaxID=1965070 RepID=A0A443R8J0_9ACAR|nr:vacuolar protein sorting-associated protein VTA1-like isoform X1 [Dinothrombium tinctorium]